MPLANINMWSQLESTYTHFIKFTCPSNKIPSSSSTISPLSVYCISPQSQTHNWTRKQGHLQSLSCSWASKFVSLFHSSFIFALPNFIQRQNHIVTFKGLENMGVSGTLEYLSDLMSSMKSKKRKQMNTVSLKIRMDCEGCARKVKKTLQGVKGIRKKPISFHVVCLILSQILDWFY